MSSLAEDRWYVPPAEIRDELLSAVLHLPFAASNARAQVSQVVSATDATPTMCGGVCTTLPRVLVEHLYRNSEHRGEHVRLDWSAMEEATLETKMKRPQEHIDQLVNCMNWKKTRQYSFSKVSHVNLQEMSD